MAIVPSKRNGRNISFMSKQVLAITLNKKNGQLVMPNALSKEKYKIFLASLQEGDKVEALFELKTEDNTKAQLAKIHVCIAEIASEQGDDKISVKNDLKHRCGMSFKDEKGVLRYQSFGQCSKDELSDVIEVIIQMGNFLNMNLDSIV